MFREFATLLKSGAVMQVNWVDATSFTYMTDGKRYRFDVNVGKATEVPPPPADSARGGRIGGGGPERGRQYDSAVSPDGKLKAFYKDRNFWLSNADGSNAVAVTTQGNEKERTKFGSASWVYGEELDQITAMWWSPKSDRVAYYGFNEKPVPDYFLQMDQTKLYSKPDIEAYPKAGVDNPEVELYAYDVAAKKSVKLDVRDGKPLTNDVVGYYAYHVGWTPDGSEVTLNRTNRRQNIMELVACSPQTGKCRTVVHEEWPSSWVENTPTMQYLKDNKRFIWASERSGFRNYYLYDLTGKLIATLTNHPFEVGAIVKVDEDNKTLYYMARDGDNHMKLQLHRVGLDGETTGV
jgi:dipeptidyl-peptidase-4